MSIITGTAGDDVQIGTSGDDTIDGGFAGNDILIGGAGDDLIFGHTGSSTFEGGEGDDLIWMGWGATTGTDEVHDVLRLTANGGHDNVYSFGAEDTLIFADGGILTQFDETEFGVTLAWTNGGVESSVFLSATDASDLNAGDFGSLYLGEAGVDEVWFDINILTA